MSRTRKAVVSSLFTFTQFGMGIVSGFVLLPLIIHRLGAHDNGLWLATGELVGYLGLTELGVFSVLPWLVAARDGSGDKAAIAEYLSDAVGVGCFVAATFFIGGLLVWQADPELLGISWENYAKIRDPLLLLLVLMGVGFPLRGCGGVLSGLQDILFVGMLNVAQTALTIALTAVLITSGYGMFSLAAAAGLPPLVCGIAAAVRLRIAFPDVVKHCGLPRISSCRALLSAGIGAFLGGLGVRLMTATSSLVYASLGHPNWATLYAATGKVAQVVHPMCAVIPDSGMIGLSQIAGGNDGGGARRTAICMVLLYLLIPGFVALGLLVANPWFIRAWIGDDFYAGDDVNLLLVTNFLVGSAVTGLFKVVAVVGRRIRIGAATVVYGLLSAGLGYLFTSRFGIAGLPGAFAVVGALFALPYGLFSLLSVYEISPREVLAGGAGRWAAFTFPLLITSAWLGPKLRESTLFEVASATLAILVADVLCARPLIAEMPWPKQVRHWLTRLRLISAVPNPLTMSSEIQQ